jgi:hypothetical protein
MEQDTAFHMEIVRFPTIFIIEIAEFEIQIERWDAGENSQYDHCTQPMCAASRRANAFGAYEEMKRISAATRRGNRKPGRKEKQHYSGGILPRPYRIR